MADALALGTRPPCESTIRRVLGRVDGDGLDLVLSTWITARLPADQARRAVAVDGKTVRGARTSSPTGDLDGPARHLLAVIDHHARVVLGQVDVDGKTSEIHHFAPLLDAVDLREVVITADALHTQRDYVDYLAARGAHWVLTVKGNQPSLRRQLASMPWRAVQVGHRGAERGHGRREIRTLKVITIAAGIMFPHAAQAIQLVRRRRPLIGGQWHTETVYAITDLRPHQADPQQLAGWVRGHWQIENGLHWVRDVTYAEDDSQIRTGHAPQVMASLRNFAISAHRLAGASNIAAALRHCSRNSARTLAVSRLTTDDFARTLVLPRRPDAGADVAQFGVGGDERLEPVVRVLADGTYLSVLIDPLIRNPARRDTIMATARAVAAGVGGAELDPAQGHLVRVVEYDVPDRVGNGTGELIVLLTTILDPTAAGADELAAAYHQRWEEETGNDQLKTHLRGPGKILRSRLPELVIQEIWAWLLVHYALSVLAARAAAAADLDPDRVSFTRVLRIARRTATGTAGFPPETWHNQALPTVLAEITAVINPLRRHRSCPRAIKRGRRNSYRIKRPDDHNIHHPDPPTINIYRLPPRPA